MLSESKKHLSVPESAAASAAGESGTWSLDQHWPTLVSGLADQITEGVSALQNQIDLLLAKGSISKLEHGALGVPLDRVKNAGVGAQQINRFYTGRFRQSHEKVNLAELIEGVLQERRKDLLLLGVALRRKLKPVDVLIDPTLVHTFVNAVLDWGLPFGNRIDVRMDMNTWPHQARLLLRVSNDGLPPSSNAAVDSPSWLLLRQIRLAAGGIAVERQINAEGVSLSALFSRTVQAVDGIAAVEFSDEQSSMFKSLMGTYVLTVSSSLQVRASAREALREIGISSDSVLNFAQARQAVKSRVPQLMVVDAELIDLMNEEFEAFRRDVLREVLDLPFIEISPDDNAFDISGLEEFSMARVGRGNIREALGTAVMFELAKIM
ncbi:hypothetical protein [Hydrogenophaga sp.]|uniref:hypothetical protein n=1 Tax=Hydrogenophaga sp. TaxID=1904254 RepID=UPI0019A2911D|nr:hypothetical protein [Hydrogenophaga sp.]MBD3894127.1 hypothetical protein [Hydrogenophaga sp.]